MISGLVTRNITRTECPWLDEEVPKETLVWLYNGPTYDCISDSGTAVALHKPDSNFWVEIPKNAVLWSE
jgi:hypothetical protein